MIGVESLGHGGSSSNLSPLAQPFTVNRSHPEPNSNHLAQFKEVPYSFVFNPSMDNWSHLNPPTSIPDAISNPNLEVDSNCPTVLPSPSDYGYFGAQSISSPFTKLSSLNPIMMTATSCAFPYVQQSDTITTSLAKPQSYGGSALIHDNGASTVYSDSDCTLSSTSNVTLLVGSSQAGYTQSLSESGSTAQWAGCWNGLSDGEQERRMDFDGNLGWKEKNGFGPLSYSNFAKRGAPAIESLSTYEEDSVASGKNWVNILGSKSHIESEGQEHIDAKCSSVTQENPKVNPFSTSRTSVVGSNLIQEMPYPQISSPLAATYPDNVSFERFYPQFDSCTTDPTVMQSSSTNFSSSLFFGSPNIATRSSALNKISSKSASRKPVHTFSNNGDSAGYIPSMEETHILLNGQVKEGHRRTIQIRNGKEGSELIHVKSSTMNMDELSNNKVSTDDALYHLSKASYKPKGTQFNLPDGFTLAPCCAEAGTSVENSSDTFDHFNPGVDSPCWKGASVSRQFPFGFSGVVTAQSSAASEPLTSQLLVKELEAYDSQKIQGPQTFSVIADAAEVVSSQKANVFFLENFNVEDSLAFSKRPSSSFVSFPSTTLRQKDAVKAGLYGSKASSGNGIQFSDGVQEPREVYWLPQNTSSSEPRPSNPTQPSIEVGNASFEQQIGSEASIVDTMMDIEDAVQVGSSHVLFRPSRLEKSSSLGIRCPTELNEPLGVATNTSAESKPQKRNVQMLLHAIHSLSELLMSSCSNDVDVLQEQDHEVLQHVTNILKMVQQKSPMPELQLHQPNTSNQSPFYSLRKLTGLHKDAGVGRSQVNRVETCDVHSRHGYQNAEKGGELHPGIHGKKDDILQDFVSLSSDADIEKDNDMTEAIKKVLKQNVHDEEEMHPQTLLYKNLWLDAEAALCAMKYKARLASMKIEMERCKSHHVEDMAVKSKAVSLKVSSDINMDGCLTPETKEGTTKVISTQDATQSSITNQAEDVEASIMTKDRLLKDWLETKESPTQDIPATDPTQLSIANQLEDDEALVMARFRILKDRVDSSTPIRSEGQELPNLDYVEPCAGIGERMSGLCPESIKNVGMKPHPMKVIDLGFTENRNPWPFIRAKMEDGSPEVTIGPGMQHFDANYTEGDASEREMVKDFRVCVLDEQMMTQSCAFNKPGDGLRGGDPSSDWEHVLKEELAWHN